MKAAEVHNMKDDELVAKLIDAKQEAFNLRFRHATGELENTARLGVARRDVAKLLTVARERGIDVEKELKRMMATKRRKTWLTRRLRTRPPRPRVLSRRRDASSSQAAGEEPTSTPPAAEADASGARRLTSLPSAC